jgi:hypothetical protein
MEFLTAFLSLLGQCHDCTFRDLNTVVFKISSRHSFCNHPTVSHSVLHNLTVNTKVIQEAWESTDADLISTTQTGEYKEKH